MLITFRGKSDKLRYTFMCKRINMVTVFPIRFFPEKSRSVQTVFLYTNRRETIVMPVLEKEMLLR